MMQLYSAWYCPFAQRALVVALHLGADFRLEEVDPYDKKEAWLKVSRGVGQVPVLVTDSITVIDSHRVMEFLNEKYGGSLFGSTPEEKAEMKHWMDFGNTKIMSLMYKVLKSEDPAVQNEGFEQLTANLDTMFSQLPTSPFLGGASPSALDFSLYPFAYRTNLLLAHYRNKVLPKDGPAFEKYWAWVSAMEGVPAFKKSIDVDNYVQRSIDFYEKYGKGGGQKDL